MRILYTGGGTLGSVTPLLALAEKDGATDRLWIGTVDGPEKDYVTKQQIHFFGIKAFRLRRFFTLKTILEFPRLFLSYYQAKKIVKDFNPDIVITAGSFVGVPVCRASKSLGIPYVVIQLDVRPGLANRILFSKASLIVVPHKDFTKKVLYPTVRVCGIPVSVEKGFVSNSQRPVIVVVGGGTGANWLNRFVGAYVDKLLALGDVIHIQGNKDRSIALLHKSNYFTYFHESRERVLSSFKKADIIITRAGMGTLSELAVLGKPAIIVPMPESHQDDNAHFFVEHAAAVSVNQRDGFEQLFLCAKELLKNYKKQRNLSNNISHIFPENSVLQIRNALAEIHE